ncbi:hypothetical protein GQ42DRAFT_176766 [Ramicandelaber brevisporus]|nr:hypothetical protein GQ42DRAFT_176766 [Ramicandelaber brevisporus]
MTYSKCTFSSCSRGQVQPVSCSVKFKSLFVKFIAGVGRIAVKWLVLRAPLQAALHCTAHFAVFTIKSCPCLATPHCITASAVVAVARGFRLLSVCLATPSIARSFLRFVSLTLLTTKTLTTATSTTATATAATVAISDMHPRQYQFIFKDAPSLDASPLGASGVWRLDP